MSCHRLVLNAAAAMVTVFALGAAAMAADILEQPPSFMELRPGMTKIVKVDKNRPVQAIAIGNPSLADVSAINLGAIAVTAKAVGMTNFILFDADGKEISDTIIQVVEADAYRRGDNVKGRHQVKVFSMWLGPSGKEDKPIERRYLCGGQNCSTVEIETPLELNPPVNSSAATGTTTSTPFTTLPTPQGPAPQGPAPQGKY
jgi:Pilus formation protein N terminal region